MAAPARRDLGLTGLGFGAAQLGNLYRVTSEEEAAEAIDVAWESGIRYFDTAPHYGLGLSERRLGDALSQRPREQFALSTKVGRVLDATPRLAAAGEVDDHGFAVSATHRRRWDFSRDGVLRSIDESLQRLQTDRVDVAYLHDPDDHWDEAREAIATLEGLRDQGVVGAIGVGMNQSVMPTRFVTDYDIDVVMIAGRYTLLDRSAAEDLLPAALEHGVSIVAAGVYNSGLLSTPEVAADGMYDYGPADSGIVARARELAAICRSFGRELPEAAVQFPLQHPAVVSVVVGMRTAQHVRGTIARFAAKIPDELWRALGAR
jgi:D-threo-aldose 1-dehydrogenase